MNVLIVDDEPLSRSELEYLLQQNNSVMTIYQASGLTDGLKLLVTKQIDLLFLDIDLNNENGFTLANEINQLAKPPLVVFATAYDNYAVDAFNINAIDYVLKPFEQVRIDQAIAKVASVLRGKQVSGDKPLSSVITVTKEEKTRVIKINDIVYAVINQGELTITTTQGKFIAHETLNWLKSHLDSQRFIQVHRNVLVNIEKIHEIQPWFNHTYQIIMIDKQKLPVGRSFIRGLRQRLQM